MGFSIHEYRDTDILRKLVDEGAMTSAELTQTFGVPEDDISAHKAIGVRLAWMKRFKMVALDEKTHVWLSTEGAERVLEAQSRSAVQRKIHSIPDEALVEVVSDAMTRARLGDPLVADMLRRETQFGMSPMRRLNGKR